MKVIQTVLLLSVLGYCSDSINLSTSVEKNLVQLNKSKKIVDAHTSSVGGGGIIIGIGISDPISPIIITKIDQNATQSSSVINTSRFKELNEKAQREILSVSSNNIDFLESKEFNKQAKILSIGSVKMKDYIKKAHMGGVGTIEVPDVNDSLPPKIVVLIDKKNKHDSDIIKFLESKEFNKEVKTLSISSEEMENYMKGLSIDSEKLNDLGSIGKAQGSIVDDIQTSKTLEDLTISNKKINIIIESFKKN